MPSATGQVDTLSGIRLLTLTVALVHSWVSCCFLHSPFHAAWTPACPLPPTGGLLFASHGARTCPLPATLPPTPTAYLPAPLATPLTSPLPRVSDRCGRLTRTLLNRGGGIAVGALICAYRLSKTPLPRATRPAFGLYRSDTFDRYFRSSPCTGCGRLILVLSLTKRSSPSEPVRACLLLP